MALLPLFDAREPIGIYDAKDGVTFLGGEVVFLDSVTWNGTDLAAADVTEDGYVVGSSTKTRPAVNLASATGQHPLFLADDGQGGNQYNNGYGVLFGTLVGGITGQVTTGTTLGPSTYAGSGKITLRRNPGLYAVSLDAVDTAAGGVIPTNTNLTVGLPLGYTTTGKLSPLVANSGNAISSSPTVAYFEEFSSSMSLVTTPVDLIAALNSPSGSVSSVSNKKFTSAVIWFIGG